MELNAVKYMCTKGIDRGISIYLSIYIYYIVCIVVVCTDILDPECLVFADCMALCDWYCGWCVVYSGAWGVILGCFFKILNADFWILCAVFCILGVGFFEFWKLRVRLTIKHCRPLRGTSGERHLAERSGGGKVTTLDCISLLPPPGLWPRPP